MSEDDGPSEEDPTIALATAQSILDAADITLPTGDLYNGAYDSLGNYYQLSHQIVADPQNLLWSPDSAENEEDLDDVKVDLTAGEETEREDGDDEVERRREEKGKAVADVRDQIKIRARLSDGSRDIGVAVDKGDSVRRIARLVAEKAKVRDCSLIRADVPADSPIQSSLPARRSASPTWGRSSKKARPSWTRAGSKATSSTPWCSTVRIGRHHCWRTSRCSPRCPKPATIALHQTQHSCCLSLAGEDGAGWPPGCKSSRAASPLSRSAGPQTCIAATDRTQSTSGSPTTRAMPGVLRPWSCNDHGVVATARAIGFARLISFHSGWCFQSSLAFLIVEDDRRTP